MGLFFIVTLVYFCRAFFFAVSSKNIYPIYIVLVTVRLSLFHNETLFLLSNTLSTNVTVISDQGWAFLFIVTLVYTCRAFFCCIIKNYFSHILFWSQLVSVCFAIKFIFSFKIHCLQRFVTKVCFRPGMGYLFSSSHLSTLIALFFAVSSKNIYSIYIVLVTVRLSLFHNETLFHLSNTLSTNDTVFSDQGWAFFFSLSHLSTLVALFFSVSSKNIFPIYCFGHSSSQSVSQ